jgi:membrane carboxypeptidase/penicillin-binding protein
MARWGVGGDMPSEGGKRLRKRRYLVVVATVVLLPVIAVSAIALFAYVRAPRLVAQLDQSGALPLSPADLTGPRLCVLLAAHDRTFYRHHGLGLRDGPPLHTTVTQAVCKGLFFSGFSPGVLRHRKLALMALALGFDFRESKETQLRLYLNRTYFGSVGNHEILGFSAAARAFFGKDIRDLADREYLALVVMLVAPNTYHVIRNPAANAARVRTLEESSARACRPECLKSPPYAPCAAQTVR